MRRSLAGAITATLLIVMGLNITVSGQQKSPILTVNRAKVFERTLAAQNKPFKLISENTVLPEGKVVQKIKTNHSFEIVAIPLVDKITAAKYPQPFVGRLFTERGMKLTEVQSTTGIKTVASIPETSTKRIHTFEFVNPNANPVKVRFYFVPAENKEQ